MKVMIIFLKKRVQISIITLNIIVGTGLMGGIGTQNIHQIKLLTNLILVH